MNKLILGKNVLQHIWSRICTIWLNLFLCRGLGVPAYFSKLNNQVSHRFSYTIVRKCDSSTGLSFFVQVNFVLL